MIWWEIDIPSGVDGLSLTPELKGQSKISRTYLHGEHSFHSDLSTHFIVTNEDKFIWYSQTGEEQYFNLLVDPREEHNAIHETKYLERIEALRNTLISELKDREEGYSDGQQLVVGRTPVNTLKIRND